MTTCADCGAHPAHWVPGPGYQTCYRCGWRDTWTRRRGPRIPQPLEQPPQGPHVLLGWITSRAAGGHIVCAWCPWCLCMHTHGRPAGSGDLQHRVAHCVARPGLGSYTIAIMGFWTDGWRRWIKDTWPVADRRRILAARGYRRAGRMWWPAPYVPSEWERLERRQ